MSREARFLRNGVCYYIQTQGFKSQEIFRHESDYDRYVQLLKKYKLRFQVDIYGYRLMPAEVHLIVRPGDCSQLPLFMQGMNQSYALYFNVGYHRAGKVWGQRYKSTVLTSDHDLIEHMELLEEIPPTPFFKGGGMGDREIPPTPFFKKRGGVTGRLRIPPFFQRGIGGFV